MHCYCHSAVVGGSVVCMCDLEQHDTCRNCGADPHTNCIGLPGCVISAHPAREQIVTDIYVATYVIIVLIFVNISIHQQ